MRQNSRVWSLLILATIILGICLVLTGCGDDDDDYTGSDSSDYEYERPSVEGVGFDVVCDGETAVYINNSGGVTTVEESEKCVGR